MFSGIEEMATLINIEHEQENIHLTPRCSFTDELKIDQSIAHEWCLLNDCPLKGRNLHRNSHERNTPNVLILISKDRWSY